LLVAASPAGAQNAPVQDTDTLDPTPPGTLHPEPLPPLANPDAPSTPAKELFARKSTPFPGPPRSIGGYFDGCLAGAVPLPITGPTWQVMRLSRNRNVAGSAAGKRSDIVLAGSAAGKRSDIVFGKLIRCASFRPGGLGGRLCLG
jgi:hypothetical protein